MTQQDMVRCLAQARTALAIGDWKAAASRFEVLDNAGAFDALDDSED